VINGPARIGAGNKIFSSLPGRRAAGQEVPGEPTLLEIGDAMCPRIRHGEPRHHPRPGGDAHRQRQFVHGVLACGHDCLLGDQIVMANCATLGGHVEVGDWVTMGDCQPCISTAKIGAHSFIAHQRRRDPRRSALHPGGRTAGGSAQRQLGGLAAARLHRGTDPELRRAYRLLYRSGLKLKAALEELEKAALSQMEIRPFVRIHQAQRAQHRSVVMDNELSRVRRPDRAAFPGPL